MKKLFVTLFFTLILTIAYFGAAHAQLKAAPVQNPVAGGTALADKHKGLASNGLTKKRSASSRGNSGTAVSQTPPVKATDKDKDDEEEAPVVDKTGKRPPLVDEKGNPVKKAKETTEKTDAKKGTVLQGSATSAEVKNINYDVNEDEKGDFIVSASDAGCTSKECKKREVKLDTNRTLLNKSGNEIPELKALTLKALQKIYGDVKDVTKKPEEDKKVAAEEKRKQDKIDTCKIDVDGKYFKDSDAQADCIQTKLAELIESRDPANDKKIDSLKSMLLEKYTADLVAGKDVNNSPFIELVMNNMKGNSRVTALMIDVQAQGHINALAKMNEDIQAQFTLAQNNINSGNLVAAKAASEQIAVSQKAFKTLTTSTIGTVRNTQYAKLIPELNTALTDFDVTLLKVNSNIVTAQNKSGNKSTVAATGPKKFGFSIDNTAVESASLSTSSGRLLNTEDDFDRNYARSIRGLRNNDFQGTSPTLRPDALIGTGSTALTNASLFNNTNTQNQNPTINAGNSPGARFAGRQ